MNENVNRVIVLQQAVDNQIMDKGKADDELVEDLINMIGTLNSYECELMCEWYNKQAKNKEYVQLELDFKEEQEGQDAILAQWNM